MVEAISDVVPGLAVPEPHDQHVNHVAHVGCGGSTLEDVMLHAEEDQPHENVITEPKRQSHVPTVPEVLDVFGFERLIEVHRCLDAHQITDADSEQAVTSEIKEQIHTVSVHVSDDVPGKAVSHQRPHLNLGHQYRTEVVGQDEFVDKSLENVADTLLNHIQVGTLLRHLGIISFKPSVTVDWSDEMVGKNNRNWPNNTGWNSLIIPSRVSMMVCTTLKVM